MTAPRQPSESRQADSDASRIGPPRRRPDRGPAGSILGFVLGPALEEYVRRTPLLSRGDIAVFVTDPVSLSCLVLIGVALALALGRNRRGSDGPRPGAAC